MVTFYEGFDIFSTQDTFPQTNWQNVNEGCLLVMTLHTVITLHIARNPVVSRFAGCLQVVIGLTEAFVGLLMVSEVHCLYVGVPTKSNI